MKTENTYTTTQLVGLVLLRMIIGWHFLYEGIVKVLNPKWTSYGYLMDSKGWLQSFFQSLAENFSLLQAVDFLNEWALLLIGLALIVGCLARVATIGAMVLLAFYYLSHPPLIGYTFLMPSEGSYLWIDKNIVEIAALFVLYVFPTSGIVGIDRWWRRIRN
ncbi:MAG: DoxX family membrane protein [Dysgonamonadaceae bacterium]|jgi:thiosulfate dehydrogenase [quinone] large subunit|nr:DoxX family membrane protein [Dysgonamonadaceae bacterium]